MKKLYSNLCFFIALMAMTHGLFAAETKIRVLALTTGGANGDVVTEHLKYLEKYWETLVPTVPPLIGVDIVNNELPYSMTGKTYTGIDIDQIAAHPNFYQLREDFAAEVAIVFTGEIATDNPDDELCGYALYGYWRKLGDNLAEFKPDADGLDLRGRNDS